MQGFFDEQEKTDLWGCFSACINYGEAFCPEEIENKSVCIDGDIGDVLWEIS